MAAARLRPICFRPEQHKIRVCGFDERLVAPLRLAFLPNGDMLVTERDGRLRLIRDGVLDPKPIGGAPQVYAKQLSGLMDIALHPKFAEIKWVHLTYTKPVGDKVTTALARGRYEAGSLADCAIFSSPIPLTTAAQQRRGSCSPGTDRCT